jgi:hypothetical protein
MLILSNYQNIGNKKDKYICSSLMRLLAPQLAAHQEDKHQRHDSINHNSDDCFGFHPVTRLFITVCYTE